MNTDYFHITKTSRLQQISATLSFDLTKQNEDIFNLQTVNSRNANPFCFHYNRLVIRWMIKGDMTTDNQLPRLKGYFLRELLWETTVKKTPTPV